MGRTSASSAPRGSSWPFHRSVGAARAKPTAPDTRTIGAGSTNLILFGMYRIAGKDDGEMRT
ncbi:MAG: hypothetical protein QGH14_06060 [Candidatus Bathyarchaeota archaeon]|nr:hypothetical protein [Candidatus Bathyarchaeota archaeon]